ncbi:Putative transcriptional regulatory protein C2H10.01 [Fusarium oxysporum f. sp. cubense race 1]|uniref:Putative transcriptional regulatory protein C2H10.01 n=1 Tax=Fusarium oxysporum f. sp. cubense (strain race 1) TaxID=1229664 RepID=N4UHC5_FUSC1|nr:Putative transcriptional regulatory protein C2H10.01 [Fusarium oxysporum f. sp. cubense race 1]
MSERDDDVTPQRKRIAVACGRCRKRKIRCSGDTGNGGPCTNCKNAGFEPCQFLRVASHEAPIVKSDGFSYSLEASRQYQARGSSAMSSLPSTAPAYTDGVSSYTSDPFVYRAPTTHGYGAKPYCPLATWGHGYTDDQSYYNSMYQAPYSSVHDSDYAISHRIASGTPGKSALCVDMEPNYAYSGGNNVTSLVHRPVPVTTDSGSLALGFQNMPGSVNIGDRLLPAPVGWTALPNSMGSSYKNDSGSSIYSSSSKSSQASTSDTSPVSSTSEAPSSYTSYESSSMSSTSGCLPSYPANLASQYGRPSNDYYSYTGSSDASVLGPADSMRQGPEMTYRYIDTTNSVTAAPPTTARRDMSTLNSSGISSFPLGHSNVHYMTNQSAAYMMPASDLGSVGADAAADSYRKATGTLRA